MSVEGDPTSGTFYIDDLNATFPGGDEDKSQGDDHLRLIKKSIKNTFPSVTAPVTADATELNKLDGVTVTTAEINSLASIGATTVATQLAAKQATITGAATTIDTENLTASRALVSDGSGKVGVSATTSAELAFVSGVTSAIQTQLGNKANLAGPTFTGTVILPSTTSIGNVSSTELGYVDGVTSAIQTQIDNLKKFDIQFNLDIGANNDYTILQDAQFAFTIDSAYYKTASGTITLNVKYDGTNSVTSLSALAVTSTEANTTSGATKTVAAGNRVSITTSSNSSATFLSVTLHCIRS